MSETIAKDWRSKPRKTKSGLLEWESKAELVRWIKRSAAEAGLSIYKLEKLAGINKGDLNKIISQAERQPGWYIVCRLAATLGSPIPTPSFSEEAMEDIEPATPRQEKK